MQDGTTLKLKETSKSFGGLVAVHRVSFEVTRGQIFAIIGPNGAGKTTLFNLINGLLDPSSGEIWLGNRRIDGLPPYRIASLGIARTFQNLKLFTNMSVLENVMVGRHARSRAGFLSTALRLPHATAEERRIRDKAMEKLSLVGLEDKAMEAPLSLPFGQQKLLEVARALATEPQLLLLDEPAGGLSTHEIENLARWVFSVRDSGVTILLVEHRMELVMGIADRVMVLNYGEKIAEGTPQEVQKDEQVIAAYLGDELD